MARPRPAPARARGVPRATGGAIPPARTPRACSLRALRPARRLVRDRAAAPARDAPAVVTDLHPELRGGPRELSFFASWLVPVPGLNHSLPLATRQVEWVRARARFSRARSEDRARRPGSAAARRT